MSIEQIKKQLSVEKTPENSLIKIDPASGMTTVYGNSVFEKNGITFFIGKEKLEKYLYLLISSGNIVYNQFKGEEKKGADYVIKKCPLTTANRIELQKVFEFTKSKTLGLVNSFGFGDRLGQANAGHIRSLAGSDFKPILAQQSIRELTRTHRTADEVMDAAVWAVFQEGFTSGFGSDADHLKTTADIDMLQKAGFTMFTFDPSEHVNNNADSLAEEQLYSAVARLSWSELKDTFPAAERRYVKGEIVISPELTLKVTEHEFLKAYAKYGNAILYIKKMYEHLKSIASAGSYEVEVSVDETESITSPFEHYFFANELKRLDVKWVSLAPRFVGAFEKGIDYKGDLDLFKAEYIKHLAVTNYFGNYKISLHSGSDKFSVYKVIGSLKQSFTHVKTAGTSYLEALKVVADKNPDLFRNILDFASSLYETEKLSYLVSADLKNLKKGSEYHDSELVGLFDSTDARQVLHVTFGRTLSEKNSDGSYRFKDGILKCLKENEETHYSYLIKHFQRHMEPFK
jgi:hypothetical protein